MNVKLPKFIPFDPNELLLGYQKRWVADDSQLKIAEKSRRTGLTWAEAADDVLIASRTKADGGSDVFYIGSNKEMAREFIDACAMWASKFNRASGQIQEELFEDEDKDILTYVIYFASGFKIKALSSNPKNLRGMQGVVCIDEAGFHEKLAEVLKAALALTMWGAKVRLISTHNGVDNLFNQLIQDSRAGRKSYFAPANVSDYKDLSNADKGKYLLTLGRAAMTTDENTYHPDALLVYYSQSKFGQSLIPCPHSLIAHGIDGIFRRIGILPDRYECTMVGLSPRQILTINGEKWMIIPSAQYDVRNESSIEEGKNNSGTQAVAYRMVE